MKPPATGELEKAIQSVRIEFCSVEKIKEVLRLVMIKIGLRAQNWPTDEEKLVLIEHIITNYGGHTPLEIKLAFDMALAGKLEIEEVCCYENFSCMYFSNIMNAYRLWAREEIPQVKQIQLPPPQIEFMSDNEFIEMNLKSWKARNNYGMISIECYGILVKQGKINLTQEEKDEMYRTSEIKLIARVGTEKEAEAAKRVYDQELINIYQSPNKNHWKARVFNECKKRAVETYFKSL